VFAANVQSAFAVMRAQSTEAYGDHWKSHSERIIPAHQAWNTVSDLVDNREESQQCAALQVNQQLQKLATIQNKARQDGKLMSGIYAKARAVAHKMGDAQREAQKGWTTQNRRGRQQTGG
jgi:hypothetical protein